MKISETVEKKLPIQMLKRYMGRGVFAEYEESIPYSHAADITVWLVLGNSITGISRQFPKYHIIYFPKLVRITRRREL